MGLNIGLGLTGRQGVPRQICPGGIDRNTVLRVPITALAPIRTSGPMKQSVATHAPFSITIWPVTRPNLGSLMS